MNKAREPEAGLSLIEVLVVLAIVGVMTGVTVLGLGSLDRGSRAEAEAMRLGNRLGLASDEVIVTTESHALEWDELGYSFVAWDRASQTWKRSAQLDLGERHNLPAALRLEREDVAGNASILITPDLPQPPVIFRIAGGSLDWRIGFDGFAASVAEAR